MDVIAALSAERMALLAFITLLEQEQRLLVENNTEPLLEIAEKKAEEALRLNQMIEARRVLLQKHIPVLTADVIHAWLAKNAPGGIKVWDEIVDLGTRAHRTNQTNGELIQMKLRANQQVLAVLNSAANKANLYGPNGQPNFSPGSGRSLGSG
ncbi:MAG: flagellar protein FlgN [Gallionella sp.]|nr:flagellar protein FlgN [Gallionella sp.]